MPSPARIQPARGRVTQEPPRNLAAEDPRKRDHLLRAVGRGRSTLPGKASTVAQASGHSESQESRIRSGERLSPTAHAALALYEAAREALTLEQAGYVSAFIEATLKAVAMWPELEKLSTEELHEELRREIVRNETRANGLCNNLEADYLNEGRLDVEALLEGHTKQATSSERIMAILQILAQRQD